MNCDQAFELLTDCTRAGSPELAVHLLQCPRCRQMRETLSPALEFLAESTPRNMSSPARAVNRGDSLLPSLEAVQMAERIASDLRLTARHSGFTGQRRRQVWKYVAAFAAGISATLGLTWLGHNESGPPSLTPTVCTWQHPELARAAPSVRPNQVVATCVACHLNASR